jgi:hypothetical protein
MSRQLQPLVRSQILFREVNERLREVVGSFDGPLEFLCECSDEDCIETIGLSVEQYEHVRSNPNLFVIGLGHETPEVDRVVDQIDGYLLVEKKVGTKKVIASYPRRRRE